MVQNSLTHSIVHNLQVLNQKISAIVPMASTVRLLAVSKTKPVSDIMAAYEAGQRDFGENYVEEFVEKSSQLPGDINWHFIGHIQSNKAKKLCQVHNLRMIETLDSIKLADKINKELVKAARQDPLDVLVQVLTGGEDTKYGVDPSQVEGMVQHIQKECPALHFKGLMAMGALNDEQGFKTMHQLKKSLLPLSGLDECEFVLSMGTSQDYELAIEHGSNEVRLGTTIFGARNYPQKQE